MISEEAKYWIRVSDGKKEIDIGEKATLETSNFVLGPEADINFNIRAAWLGKMPDWLKKKCPADTTICTVSDASTFYLSNNSGEWFFNVTLMNSNQSFKIMIGNGSETPISGYISRNKLNEQEQKWKKLQYSRNAIFWQRINLIKANLSQALNLLKNAKQAASDLKKFWEGMVKNEEARLKKLLEEKKKIEADIQRLNTIINNKKNDVRVTITQRTTCDEEHVNLLFAIETEEKKNKRDQQIIDKNLADAKKKRQEKLKELFYWLEASYFYRVFAERLVKNVAALDAATTEATIKGTQTKIKSAFKPIEVTFAAAVAK
jgi:hypothetical protein